MGQKQECRARRQARCDDRRDWVEVRRRAVILDPVVKNGPWNEVPVTRAEQVQAVDWVELEEERAEAWRNPVSSVLGDKQGHADIGSCGIHREFSPVKRHARTGDVWTASRARTGSQACALRTSSIAPLASFHPHPNARRLKASCQYVSMESS